MKKKKVIVGSRESKLAVMQTQLVIDELAKNNPDIEFELVTMKTTGDIILDKTLDKIGGKGLFVKRVRQGPYGKKSGYNCSQPKRYAYGSIRKTAIVSFF